MLIYWFVEHVSRELDVACLNKIILEKKYKHAVRIYNLFRDSSLALKSGKPDVVVLPYFYSVKKDPVKTITETWPDILYFNLAWEQIFYRAHEEIKAPGDDFTKTKVHHHAWGIFFRNYLVERGVPEYNIHVNGHPAYQLYLDPYRKYFWTREQLADAFNLNPDKRWIFIPENFKWAFFSDERLKEIEKDGGSIVEMEKMREFCISSLSMLVQWCGQISVNPKIEIIFRPRPAVNSDLMKQYIKGKISKIPSNFHVIKDKSVREWVLASEVSISSYSTTLIEAAIAGKDSYMAMPVPIPDALHCDWYSMINQLTTYEEFERACSGPSAEIPGGNRLKKWAIDNMLAHGDAVAGLSLIIHGLQKYAGKNPSETVFNAGLENKGGVFVYSMLRPLLKIYSRMKAERFRMHSSLPPSGYLSRALWKLKLIFMDFIFFSRKIFVIIRKRSGLKGQFDSYNYEMDNFSGSDIEMLIKSWKRILL